jgi:ankyrin repeat protein
MTVTKSVYLALRDLRYQEKDRVLWIDALCINQNNDEERGQQVQQMGSIYGKAKRVIIWLGEATYDTDYALHYMGQLEKQGIEHAADDQKANIWSAVVRCLTADQKELVVEGFQSLLRRNWFKRVWIIQETANARVAEIVCGSKSVSASTFVLMPSLLEITPDPHCQPILDIMPGPLRNSSWWAKKRDLHTMLVKFCKSEATDPRDNVYALLGISSDASDTKLLKTNYKKNLRDIIFETTSFLLDFNKLDSPIRRFFDWTLPEFLGYLHALANEVLKCAMNTENETVVRLLVLRDDINVNLKNKYNQMPLFWAAERGHKAVVKLLLKTGKVDVDSKDIRYRTPLVLAAEGGHEAVVKLLLETGKVDVDSKDINDRTPLSLAAEGGHEAVVKLLLKTGKVYVDSNDRYNQTPLSLATKRGHEAVVKLLLETGKVDVDLKDIHDRTPLFLAAEGGHRVVVKLLLDTGKVDVNSKDINDRTPLSLAAEGGHEAVVKLLLDTGKVDVDSEDEFCRTPLSWAAHGGHGTVVKLLLETGKVDVDSEDEFCRTPLYFAAIGGHEAVVKLLQSFIATTL